MTLNDASRDLAQVLRAENDLLAAGDAAGATRLLAAKQAATQALQAALPDATPDPQWAALLRQLATENRARISQAMEVQSRILELVARAARTVSPGTVRYGSRGAPHRDLGAMALALRA